MKKLAIATALFLSMACGAPEARQGDAVSGGEGGTSGPSGTGGSGGSSATPANGGAPASGGKGGGSGGTPAMGGQGGSAANGGTGNGGTSGAGGAAGMGGSAMAGMGGSAMAGMGGSAMAGMGGSAMAGMGGSAMAGMGGGAMAGMGGSAMAGMGGSPGTGGAAPAGDGAEFGFETDLQGFSDTHDKGGITLSITDKPVFAGSKALAIAISSAGVDTDDKFIGIRRPTFTVPSGAKVKYRVYVPTGANLRGVQPYVMLWNPTLSKVDWNGTYVYKTDVPRDQWVEIELTFPDPTGKEFLEFGVQFQFDAVWQGTVYVDSIDW